MVVAAGVDVVAVVLLLWYMQSRRVYFYLTVLTLHLKTLFFSNFFDFHFPPAAQKQTPYLQSPHPVGHPRHVIVPNLQWQSILATFLPRCPNTRRPMGHPLLRLGQISGYCHWRGYLPRCLTIPLLFSRSFCLPSV